MGDVASQQHEQYMASCATHVILHVRCFTCITCKACLYLLCICYTRITPTCVSTYIYYHIRTNLRQRISHFIFGSAIN